MTYIILFLSSSSSPSSCFSTWCHMQLLTASALLFSAAVRWKQQTVQTEASQQCPGGSEKL